MIRIDITKDELYDGIEALDATWLKKAKAKVAEYKAQGKYVKAKSEFWGDIKTIYIKRQHEKCAYCETKMAGKDLASKVHEVEHFRPKSKIKQWPGKARKGEVAFTPPCPVGGASNVGYFLLTYHPFNFAIACTRCNSTLKSDYFPVRKTRNVKGINPARMKSEDALLIYPVSDLDVDPCKLIRFDGVLAVPARSSGADFERAVVTIEFFKLNYEDLTSRRAQIVAGLWLNLRTLDDPGVTEDVRAAHTRAIKRATTPAREFSACARDYVQLHKSDKALAEKYGALAEEMLGR